MASYGGAIAFCGIFAVLFGSVFAQLNVVPFRPCTYPEDHGPSTCVVHELRVKPCKEAAEGKICRVKRGLNATIEFDYTASFEGDALEGYAFWANKIIDLPFIGMERNACLSTPCPVVPGTKQSYHQKFKIEKSYPVNTYDIKWKVQNAQGQDCCFMFQISIHK